MPKTQFSKTLRVINKIIKTVLPLLIAGSIMWWMYRGIDWSEIVQAAASPRCMIWMLVSMPFGIMAQVFRAMRWRLVLRPLGHEVRTGVLVNSIFLSYGSSLAIPRSGEVLRCGVVRKYEGVDFSTLAGSVVAERVIDMAMIALLTAITILSQIPVCLRFMNTTGMSVTAMLGRFTSTGYIVTLICALLVTLSAFKLASRLRIFRQVSNRLANFKEGMLSVRTVKSPTLFLTYSIGIWLSYYLHFYVAFQCFDFTADLGPTCALVAFVAGCFAVLVPTPNGAGPWHFAVKTVLMLYGVAGHLGAIFALVVHTLQTLLVAILGLWSLIGLGMTKQLNNK